MTYQETAIQKRIADRMPTWLQGKMVRREMIGKRLFVAVEENSIFGEQWIGTIGPRGKINMRVYPFGSTSYKRDFIPDRSSYGVS